jgi:hypothetical protein
MLQGVEALGDVNMAKPRDEYFNRFATGSDATEFEQQVLSVSAEYLPECAKATLAGQDSSDEYWTWLLGQYDAMYAEWLASHEDPQ